MAGGLAGRAAHRAAPARQNQHGKTRRGLQPWLLLGDQLLRGRREGPGSSPSRGVAGERLLPLGSSACLASLRSAAAKLEDGAAWADSALLVAGLPLGTRAPLSGEGVRGLTVAVVLVVVESIPSEGDLGSWLMPETGREEPEVTQRAGGQHQRGVRGSGVWPAGDMQGAGAARVAPEDSRQSRQSQCRRENWPEGPGTPPPACIHV